MKISRRKEEAGRKINSWSNKLDFKKNIKEKFKVWIEMKEEAIIFIPDSRFKAITMSE